MEIIKELLNPKHVYVWFWVIFLFSVDRKVSCHRESGVNEWSVPGRTRFQFPQLWSILPRSRGAAELKAGVCTPGNSLCSVP